MKIAASVLFVHLMVIALIWRGHSPPEKKVKKGQICVRTFQIEPPKVMAQPSPPADKKPEQMIAAAPKKESTKPKPVEKPPQKAVEKSVAKTVEKTEGKKAEKKESPPLVKKEDKLSALIEQSLKALNSTPAVKNPAPPSKTKAPIGTLASETLFFAADYEHELIAYLQSRLILPQKGEIKVKLTLKRDGIVEKIDILKADNEENRTFVAEKLAACTFPAFDKHFKGENRHTFTLTLTSENSR